MKLEGGMPAVTSIILFVAICLHMHFQSLLPALLSILVLLLLASTKFIAIFKIHDLAGIYFSNFIISSSDTYQVLSGLPTIPNNDEPSQKADL